MVELTARVAIESLLRATGDDATPIIRRLARIQARAFLDEAPTPPTLSVDLREAGQHHVDCGLLYDDGPEQCTCRPHPLREAAKAIIVKLEESEASFARNVANLPDEPPIGDDDGVCISVGDLRALRAALAQVKAS